MKAGDFAQHGSPTNINIANIWRKWPKTARILFWFKPGGEFVFNSKRTEIDPPEDAILVAFTPRVETTSKS